MEQTINICLSSTEKYAELCTIVMLSAIINANEDTKLCFYVIDNDIMETTKSKMQQFIEAHEAKLMFLAQIDIESEVGSQIDTGRWTLSTLQRLYICRTLPESIDKILYLDCDILVRGPLNDLYFTDLSDDYFAAGVWDCIGPLNKIKIGLAPNDTYINAGMLLIDVQKWRKENLEKQFVEFFKKNLGNLQYFDQDIINGVLSKRIKVMHPKYNTFTVMVNYSYEDILTYRSCELFYSKKEYLEAISNPVVVHFTLDIISIRPWYTNGQHKYRDEWLKIRSMTPWSDTPLWQDNRSFVAKAKMILYHSLPRSAAIRLARYVHLRHIKNV